jgi:hypothetical protein
METWTSETTVLWMSVAMGVGAWLVARTIEAWWRGGQIPKVMSRWIVELDHAIRDLHGAEMQRAICYRRVADLIGKMPKDFDAVALTGLAMSDDIGRAILAKSEQLGIYPKGTFSKLGVVPYEGLPDSKHAPVEPSALKETLDAARSAPMLPPPMPGNGNGNGNGHGTVAPWIGSWVDGRLVPPASSVHDEN